MRVLSFSALVLAASFAAGCSGKPEDTADSGDSTVVTDADGDGHDAVSAGGDDCDDTDAAVYPGAADAWYDGVDSDCAGNDDYDQDGDGSNGGDGGSDCDDTNPDVNPNAAEVCDGVDNDCDGTIDQNPADGAVIYADADGDGYGAGPAIGTGCAVDAGTSNTDDDCDDAVATVHPSADEHCDGIDEDCDGTRDDNPVDGLTWGADADADGYASASDTVQACTQPAGYAPITDADCNDADAAISPAAEEACDGVDNDCDGSVDETGASGESAFYEDADADTEGNPDAVAYACSAPAGYVANADDCDDTTADRATINAESDDGIDNDCDNWVDEDFVAAGDVILTEVARQPRFGTASTVTEGQWFEIHNTSSRTVDLSYWYILRTSGSSSTDAFFVDPADPVILAPGAYAVFCKSDAYAASASATDPLVCDYVWGDAAEASTYSGTYHDNTFNLQRDADRLALYVGGGSATGTVIDDITWSYTGTSSSDWPRDATYSMMLSSDATSGTLNDTNTNWCSTPTAYTWWTSGAYVEYGTPGVANPACP